MEKTAEKPVKTGIAEGVVSFIQRNRKTLIVVAAVIVGAFVATALAVTIAENSRFKVLAGIDALSQRYEEIRLQGDEASKDASIAALTEELKSFADKHGSYAGSRALMVLAGIQVDRREWAEAEASWVAAAEKASKSYMAPVALYNAATSAEERGDTARAIELYSRSADEYIDSFPMAARSYFALGRLHEERKDTAAAVAAYRKIVDTWPNDNWTKLANSRILALSASVE